MMYEKKLYKSRQSRMIAGICGGLGEYFDVDPALIRVLWVLFAFAGGAGILAYAVAYFIIPERPREHQKCRNCGHMNLPDAAYCQNCGKRLDETHSTEDSSMKQE
ncbi:PspC domain-containing protein [Candidatus Bathyarchaeota archaeon]|nr:MAG: PspC domain-containing protein [Candidatus Bathyarchaeota archaeon]